MVQPSGNISGAHVVAGKDVSATATNPLAFDFVPFGISWVFVGFVLLILASFPASEKFAAMFAYLILVSAVLIEGPTALKNLQSGTPFAGVGGIPVNTPTVNAQTGFTTS
jgi:hypothetical protein